MELADVIAILGAATGLVALVLSILNYRNARPRIFVKSSYGFLVSPQREVVLVDIRNEGQFGTEIVAVGLARSPRPGRFAALIERLRPLQTGSRVRRIDKLGTRYNQFAVNLLDDGTREEEQVFLEPRRHVVIEIPMVEAAGREHGGQMWPYAEDVTGRTYLAQSPASIQHRETV